MPQPKSATQWPTAGERRTRCSLQYAVPVADNMGGRGEPVWIEFGTWDAKTSNVPGVGTEEGAKASWQLEGPYRADLWRYFHGIERPSDVPSGTNVSIRIVTGHLTLKVFDVENPMLVNRTLIAHCAKAVNA